MDATAIAMLEGPDTYREWRNTLIVWLLTQDLLSYVVLEEYQSSRFNPPEPISLDDSASDDARIEQHRRNEEIEMWHQNNFRVLQAMLHRMTGTVQRSFQRQIDRRNSHDLFVAIEDNYTERGLVAILKANMELIAVTTAHYKTADELINAFGQVRNRLDDILMSSGQEAYGDANYARMFLTHCFASETFTAWAESMAEVEDVDKLSLTELAARLKRDVRPPPQNSWRAVAAAAATKGNTRPNRAARLCDLPGHTIGKKRHLRERCWTLHPELDPGRRGRGGGGGGGSGGDGGHRQADDFSEHSASTSSQNMSASGRGGGSGAHSPYYDPYDPYDS